MKFYKRLPLDSNNVTSNRFAVLKNNRIVTDTKVGMEMPRGADQDRPDININGTVRYNTDSSELEVYNGSSPGTGWENIRTVRPAPITVQNLGDGDYVQTVFGPLKYKSGENYQSFDTPENIFVLVENVFQIPVVNYVLSQGPGNTVNVSFTSAPPNKRITAILGYDGYFPPFPTP